VFVAMHAVNRGTAPGNLVTDPASGTFAVQTGDQITVDGTAYEVDSTELRLKEDTAADPRLWDPSITGRLVLVTCLPSAQGGAATHNAVVTAHRLD
jgi:sortase (surface protein transpeptidase)